MTTARLHHATLARRPALVTAVVAALLFVMMAASLVPWEWIPGGRLTPVASADIFTPDEIARAEEYASVRRWLGLASYLVSLAVAGILGFTPVGGRLVRRTGGSRWWVTVSVGVLTLLIIGRLATLPFVVAIRQRNLDFGLTEQGWADWTIDYGKSLLVGWVLTSVLVLIVVGAARHSPRHWFAWAGAAAALLTVAGSFIYPVVVEPVFNNFTSMASGSFRDSVFELAEDEGVAIDDVLVADASRRTTTLNAYVSGFGSTRRVVIFDTTLAELTPDQARVIIAHELAHAKHNDVLVGTTLGAAGALLGLTVLALLLDSRGLQRLSGTSGPADPGAVAVILALVALGGLMISPAQTAISRAIEVRADRVAIAATGGGGPFVDMQHELAVHALQDPTPPRWSYYLFSSHPTVLERAGIPRSLEEAK